MADDCDTMEVAPDHKFEVPDPDLPLTVPPEVDEILRTPEVWLITRPGC